MSAGAGVPADDAVGEPAEEDAEPESGCYIVETPWVPILTEPSHDASEVGRLHRGEFVVCDRVAGPSESRSTWVKVSPAAEVHLTRCAVGEAEAKVRRLGEGGFIVQHHCILGTLLRHTGAPPGRVQAPSTLSQREIDEVVANARREGELDEEVDMPAEARLWSREQLEAFIAQGTCPQWRLVSNEADLSGRMSPERLDEVLRTAVEWLWRADAILVASGAGMAADSGLPTLSESNGTRSWPAQQQLGLRYEELCDERWFGKDPHLAWAFWSHVREAQHNAEPHRGYEIVQSWAKRAALGGFVFTTNVDSQWLAAGWPEEKLIERHGALHFLQCSAGCCKEVWPMPEALGFVEDPTSHRADGDLPRCPSCGSVARPFVEMFGGDEHFNTALLEEQRLRWEDWRGWLWDSRYGPPTVLCLELGCSPGSAGRRFIEEALAAYGSSARLVRVNPQHATVNPAFAGQAVAVPLRALDALTRMEQLDGVIGLTSFICQDAEGNGAEVLARCDAAAGHVLRRAVASVWDHAELPDPQDGPRPGLRAQSVLNEREEVEQKVADPVPPKLQVVTRDGDYPVVRLNVSNVSFKTRNARMETRLQAVWKMLQELLDAYGGAEYQSKLEACTDRAMVANLVREVHFRVLPANGICMNVESGSGEAAKKVIAMQAFLQSGKFDPEVGAGLSWSVHLSGYSKIYALPAAKAKGISAGTAAAAGAIVLSEAPKKAAESKWTSSYRPPKVLWIAGTWNKWEPKEMKWDGSKFVDELDIGKSGWDSFQIMVMGRWEAAIYPSVKDGNPYVEYRLLGPDNKGHGRNWTIGKHPRDGMRAGDRVQVAVDVDAKGAARKVSWKRMGDGASHSRFNPQFTGAQLLTMEAQIVGQWQYGSKPNIYEVSKIKQGQFRFEGPHAGGRVSGELHANGTWLQADLVNNQGMLVGSIRLSYLKEDDSMISNFRNMSKQDWGKDIAARRVAV